MIQATQQPNVDPTNKPIQWIHEHPTGAFVLLAFALSWATWGLSALIPTEQEIVQLWASRLGTFGPAVAAMLLAWILNPKSSHVRPALWWTVFLGSGLFGWLYYSWKGDIDYQANSSIIAYILAGLVMMCWAFMIAGITAYSEGVRRLMQRQIQFPGWGWILFVVCAPLAIEFLGLGLTNLLGRHARPWFITGQWDEIAPLVISVITGVWIAGGANEEAGWRGFMQAHLQKRFNPLFTGIIIGVVMGLWHFPLHFLGFYAGNDLYAGFAGLTFRILSNMVLGIAFTWLYNRSRGSLLLVMLFHVAINTSSVFIASTSLTQVLMFAAALAPVFIDRMWRKLPSETTEALQLE